MNPFKSESDNKDLRHFLRLASARVGRGVKDAETAEGYSNRVRRMRILEELIREQLPNESENPGASVGPSR